jgi:hypothetical protein
MVSKARRNRSDKISLFNFLVRQEIRSLIPWTGGRESIETQVNSACQLRTLRDHRTMDWSGVSGCYPGRAPSRLAASRATNGGFGGFFPQRARLPASRIGWIPPPMVEAVAFKGWSERAPKLTVLRYLTSVPRLEVCSSRALGTLDRFENVQGSCHNRLALENED